MIQLAKDARACIEQDEHPKLVLTCYSNTFVTPAYVRFLEKEAPQIKHLILRNALVGLNTPKMMILKGFNLLVGTDFQAFATERAALEYLLENRVESMPAIFPLR